MTSYQEHKTYFENIREELAKELMAAKYSIFAAVAWLTDDYLIEILEEKAKSGVSVQLIISGNEYNRAESFLALTRAGGETYIVGGGDVQKDKFMHNKFCVIDYKKVITGSYNWSRNASTNEENIIIIEDKLVSASYINQCLDLISQGDILTFDDSNDIIVSFVPSKNYVDKGEEVRIQWEVKNADEVSISQIGDKLDLDDKHSLIIQNDTILTLNALSDRFSKTKSIHIRIIPLPKINSFTLSEKVILRGTSTELSWETENTQEVSIDNGIGQVSKTGSQIVAPITDTIYKIIATGETKTVILSQHIIVYPIPILETILIPSPTKINFELDIGFFSNKVPSSMKIDLIKNNLVQKVPKINFISAKISTKPPTIKEIAKSLDKEIHELRTPDIAKQKLRTFKKKIFNKLEEVFKNNWKISQIISKIRNIYGI